jgi:hypothetical protein
VAALDDFRRLVLRNQVNLDARRVPWGQFRAEIDRHLGPRPTAQLVFDLGARLKQVFKSHVRDRSASSLSRGGASWEILVCWYLNFVFWNTDTVVIRPSAKLVPEVVRDALSIKVKGVLTTKETDLLVVSLPPQPPEMALGAEDVDALIRGDPTRVAIGVIQCKTNWNDNAQAPMLWNIVYSARNLHVPGVTVGTGGFAPSNFGGFSYAFVTVPTNTERAGKDAFKPSSTAVVRVAGLSGGNYWGCPSRAGVADQVSEYFGRNFAPVFSGGVLHHLGTKVLQDPKIYQMFLDFDF